jgi:MSHA biogenesis protein MshK
MSRAYLVAAAMTVLAPAWAQALSDPTRPPHAPSDSPQDAAAGGTQLQSVLISRGRRLAIINGSTVALGDTVGEAKVVRISETEVVLQRGDEKEVLKLFPGVEKQPARRGAGRAQTSSPQGRSQ